MKNVYVLLTRNHTTYSRLIYAITGDEFTHAALALDDQMAEIYSFCRRYMHLPLPAGFERESLYHGIYGSHSEAPCAVFAVRVTDEAYDRLKCELRQKWGRKRAYGYNLLGALSCGLGRQHVSCHGRMFCSEFVTDALLRAGAVRLKRPAALVRPNDLQKLPELKCVFKGSIAGLRAQYGAEVSMSRLALA